MIQIEQTRRAWISVVAGLSLMAGIVQAQAPKKKPGTTGDEVKDLIDRLTEIDQQDVGYSGSVTGSAFLPLGQSATHAMLLGQTPNESSDALKSLVKLGTKALPTLIKHLNDERPTKITLTHPGGFGGMFITQDEDDGAKKKRDGFRGETRYTLMVGDLCYVAVGQIVNRNYWAVRYQPTAIIYVTAVPKSKKLREDVAKAWGNLTPEKHRDSLMRDLLDPKHESDRNNASLRLAYYYPTALEGAALKILSRPTYSGFAVNDLIQNKLYPAKAAKERKALVEEFVTKNGEIARDGIRWALFEELESQEAQDEGRGRDPHIRRARECLIEAFGLPATVKSTDRPREQPLDATTQAGFVKTLHFDRSEKLDRALRDLLAKTDDDYLAKGCLDRLVGRGYDAEIETYLKRRLPHLKARDWNSLQAYEAKLGWTRLHAAVNLDVMEFVESALAEKIPIDARGRDGRTALHIAASMGRTDLVSVLLAHKADRNVKDEKGQTPLDVARGTAVIKRLEK